MARIPWNKIPSRPPATARRALRRRYPNTLTLLSAWGDEDATRALQTVDPGGRACTPAGACTLKGAPHAGHCMLHVARIVRHNPGVAVMAVVRAVGPHGSIKFGHACMKRAIKAGLVYPMSGSGTRGGRTVRLYPRLDVTPLRGSRRRRR